MVQFRMALVNRRTRSILVPTVLVVATIVLALTPSLGERSAAAQNTTATGSAGSNANINVQYDSQYVLNVADASKPLTIDMSYHLYHPGETVPIKGSVWTEVTKRVAALNVVKVDIKDAQGNIIGRQDAPLNSVNGSYATSIRLFDNAAKGTYTTEARIELQADALGIINAITSAALQSSVQFAVANTTDYAVSAGNQNFAVKIASNSGINNFEFKQADKRVSFFVEGDSGTMGVTEITIPKNLLGGQMSVLMDQNVLDKQYVLLKSDTEAATTFEINYHHSIHRVEVTGSSAIPEFPITTTLAIPAVLGIIAVLSRTTLFSRSATHV